MWPWEHLAVGYLCYSAYARRRYERLPTGGAVVLLAVATQFPDLIDKPLAWTFDVLPTGFSLAHSVFVAAGVIALAVAVAWRRDTPWIGAAVAIGYTSHLLGDLLYPVLRGDTVDVGILLWPLVSRPAQHRAGLFVETARLFREFVGFLGTPRGIAYLVFEVALLGGVLVLWMADGRPGLRAGE